MNDKPNFKPLPTPEAVRADSPEGQKAMAIMAVYGGVCGLAGMQAMVNAFSFFFASASLESGMDEESFQQALKEIRHLIEVNRAMISKREQASRPA